MAPFRRETRPEEIVATADNESIRYALTRSGQVFRTGTFVPQSKEGTPLDYSTPKPVDGLGDVAEMLQRDDQVFVRRRDGLVESWWNHVVRDEDGQTLRTEETKRALAAREKFVRMFISQGKCFDTGAKIHCLSSGVETYDQTFQLPLPFPSSEVTTVVVRKHLCVLKKSGEVLCIEDPLRKDPKLGLPGESEFLAGAKLIPHRFVDMIDSLWGFVGVDDANELWLFNPERTNFGLTKLTTFDKVRDFSWFPCIISLDGRIRCHHPNVSFGSLPTDGQDVMIDASFEP